MKTATCRRCGAAVWRGPDNDVMAIDATVDQAALSVTGECLAVLAGRRTYSVDAASRRHARRIWRRWPDHLGAPDPMGGTLHAAHVCAQPIPADWAAPTPAAVTLTPREGELLW